MIEQLLSVERLAEIQQRDNDYGTITNFSNEAIWERHQLLQHIAALTARATKAESREAELLAEFVAGIQPADIPSCLEAHSEPAFGEFLRGANSVHATNLRWARWKAAELGLPWPLPAAEFGFGYTPDAAPTPPPSSPAAAGPVDSPAKQARKKAQAVLEGRVGPASLIQPSTPNG